MALGQNWKLCEFGGVCFSYKKSNLIWEIQAFTLKIVF